MSGRDIIEDNLTRIKKLYDKEIDRQMDEFVKKKMGEDIITQISADSPTEMKEFCSRLKNIGYSSSTEVIKEVVYNLVKDKKIVYTKNRLNEEYFQKV